MSTDDPVDQKLNEILDLEPNEVSTMELLQDEPVEQELIVSSEEERQVPEVSRETSPATTTEDSESADTMDDYELARQNIRQMIDNGQRVLNRIMYVVNGSDSARDFEVAAQMIKALSDMNRDLIKMHKDMHAMKKKGEVKPKGDNVTNNVFMTTDDMLQKMIEQQNKTDGS